MISNYKDHADVVRSWIGKASADLTAEQLIQLLDSAFITLWKQARLSISSVMLEAITDRVIFNCSETYPFIGAVKVSEQGIDVENLRKSARTLDSGELKEAIRVMTTEFLAILGSLTNQVVSPQLHVELSKVKFEPKLKALPSANGDDQ